jgi:ElaB/YqjD/DUF883 family membrane-anchored ribosome-binding protein
MAERDHLTTGESSSGTSPARERSTEEIRQDIASTRESITDMVDQLSSRVGQTLNWRTYVSDYPLASLGVAAGIGYLASGLFRHRSTPKQRITGALADTVGDLTDRFRYQLDAPGLKRPGLKGAIKTAAFWAIARAATGYLRNRLVTDDTQKFGN